MPVSSTPISSVSTVTELASWLTSINDAFTRIYNISILLNELEQNQIDLTAAVNDIETNNVTSDFIYSITGLLSNLTTDNKTTLAKAINEVDLHVDNHLADLNNPHQVTKTQVGLSEVPNVDATDRANHTGTQYSSTISDFDSAVNNLISAIALLDYEVASETGLKTLIVPDNTTISAYAATLLDDTTDVDARTTLDVYSKTEVDTAISDLVDSSPETLDTLNELAAALGDDPNFATTVTNQIASKVDQTEYDARVIDVDATLAEKLNGITFYSRSVAESSSVPTGIHNISVKQSRGFYLDYKEDTATSNAALTTSDGRKWVPYMTITPNHWVDNVTPGTTDMSGGLQSAIDYAAEITEDASWYEDDRGSLGLFRANVVISGINGEVYGLESGVFTDRDNRMNLLKNISFKAIGSSWAATDYMLAPTGDAGSFFGVKDVSFNCNGLSSGLNIGTNWYVERPVVRRIAFGGKGITFTGSNAYLAFPDVSEWTQTHAGFFDEDNYGAVGLSFEGEDNRVIMGSISWCSILIDQPEQGGGVIIGTHLFNGMENFGLHNKDGSLIADNPAGTPATGRANPIGLRRQYTGTDIKHFKMFDVYFDNCRNDIYDDRAFVANDCYYHSNSNHSNGDQTEWFRFYAYESGCEPSHLLDGAIVGVKTRAKKLVSYYAGSYSWLVDTTQLEEDENNILDTHGTKNSYAYKHIIRGRKNVVQDIMSSVTETHTRWHDSASTTDENGGLWVGSVGDLGVFRSKNGFRFRDEVNNPLMILDNLNSQVTGSLIQNSPNDSTAGKLARADYVLGKNLILSSVQTLLTSTDSYNVGDIISVGTSIQYEVVSSGGHVTTSGGVELKVLPENGNIYHIEAWGPEDAADIQAAWDNIRTIIDAETWLNVNNPYPDKYVCKFSSHMALDAQLNIGGSAMGASFFGVDLDWWNGSFVVTGTWDATTPAINVALRNSYVKTPHLDCQFKSSGIHFTNGFGSIIEPNKVIRWGYSVDAIGLHFDAPMGGSRIINPYARQMMNTSDEHYYDDEYWTGSALLIDAYDFDIVGFNGGRCGVVWKFTTAATNVTISDSHPYNGRTGDPMTDPSLIECYKEGGYIKITGCYLDNGLIHDYGNSLYIAPDCQFLEYAPAVTLTQPYLRKYCYAGADGTIPDISFIGGYNLSYDYFDDETGTYSWACGDAPFSALYDEMRLKGSHAVALRRKVETYTEVGESAPWAQRHKADGPWIETLSTGADFDTSNKHRTTYDPRDGSVKISYNATDLIGVDENQNLIGEAHKPIVLLAIGQSNMASTTDQGGGDQTESHGVLFWNCNSHNDITNGTQFNVASFGTVPLSWGDGSGGYANNLAFQTAKQLYQRTMRPVYVIMIARGAHNIESWMKSTTLTENGWSRTNYDLYQMAVDNIPSALAVVPNGSGKIDAIIVHQGEANSADGAELYAEKLGLALDDLADIDNQTATDKIIDLDQCPVVFGQIAHGAGTDWVYEHNSALHMVINGNYGNVKNGHVVQSKGLEKVNTLHFSGKGLEQYGGRYAIALDGGAGQTDYMQLGLGTYAIQLQDTDAFKNITASGLYSTINANASTVGAPSSNGGTLRADVFGSAWQSQTYHDVVNGNFYSIVKRGGTWQSWLRHLDESDVQVSATDTTADALLTVGAGGLLSTNQPTISDLDDHTIPTGFYLTSGSTSNAPSGYQYGSVQVYQRFNSNAGVREVIRDSDLFRTVERHWNGSEWSWWMEHYHQGSILGTVSQSSGVPRGAIIETGGSIGSGQYTKWADGTMICSIRSFITAASAEATWTYGVTFIENPVPIVSTRAVGTTVRLASVSSLSTTSLGVVSCDITGDYTVTPAVDIMVVGRWF